MYPESPKFMDKGAASVLASHYSTLFDDLELEDLKNQTSTAKGFSMKANDKPKTIHDIVKAVYICTPSSIQPNSKSYNIFNNLTC